MKKNPTGRKLKLETETLQRLTSEALETALGGAAIGPPELTTSERFWCPNGTPS